jgi:hypothetical protein
MLLNHVSETRAKSAMQCASIPDAALDTAQRQTLRQVMKRTDP